MYWKTNIKPWHEKITRRFFCSHREIRGKWNNFQVNHSSENRQNSHWRMFYEVGVSINFVQFKEKSYKIADLQLYEKETPTQVFSCEYCEFFKNSFYYKTPPLAAFRETNWVIEIQGIHIIINSCTPAGKTSEIRRLKFYLTKIYIGIFHSQNFFVKIFFGKLLLLLT